MPASPGPLLPKASPLPRPPSPPSVPSTGGSREQLGRGSSIPLSPCERTALPIAHAAPKHSARNRSARPGRAAGTRHPPVPLHPPTENKHGFIQRAGAGVHRGTRYKCTTTTSWPRLLLCNPHDADLAMATRRWQPSDGNPAMPTRRCRPSDADPVMPTQ